METAAARMVRGQDPIRHRVRRKVRLPMTKTASRTKFLILPGGHVGTPGPKTRSALPLPWSFWSCAKFEKAIPPSRQQPMSRAPMCDYSLHNVKTRSAKVGDKLTTRLFKTGTRGFCAPEDASVAV